MKKYTLSLYFLFIVSYTIAQTYAPFPDSAATWVNCTMDPQNPQTTGYMWSIYPGNTYTVDGGDTIIYNKKYTKLYFTGANGSKSYAAGIRDSLGKVTIVPKDSMKIFNLYDFNAKVGDTIFNVYQENLMSGKKSINSKVISINSYTDSNNIVTRVLRVDNIYAWGLQNASYRIIEGVGSDKGLLKGPGNAMSPYYSLYCMSHYNTCYYDFNMGNLPSSCTPLGCALNTTIFEHIQEDDKIICYPNPTNRIIEVKLKNNTEINEINIYNSKGELVFIKQCNTASKITVDLNDYSNGIYFIRIKSEEKYYTKKMIKN